MDTTESYSIKEMELKPFSQGYTLKISIVSNAVIASGLNKQFPEKQLEMKKSSYSTYAEYGEITKNISSDGNVDFARKMYIDAVELYRLGKQKGANELLTGLLRKHADHKAARTLLAQKLISQGQLQQAEELLYEGLSSQKGNTVWVDLYARLLVNKGDIDNAIDVLAGVTPDVSSEPDYFAFLAALYQKNEQHSEAIKIYREVLKVSPAKSVWWMGLAISLESLQQDRDALYAYNRALQGDRMTQDLQKYVLGKIEYLNKRS
jgi:MSHA biogenesis protein MshN